MAEHTLIANSGIQVITFPLVIDTKNRTNKMWYHEWYDNEECKWCLELLQEVKDEDECYFYKKKVLYDEGYLSDASIEIKVEDLKEDGIFPLEKESQDDENISVDIFDMTFSSRYSKLAMFENVWLPIPYFFKKTPKRFDFGPLNWSRIKLIPAGEENGMKKYDVLLAFDTRTKYQNDEYKECPVFPDTFRESMEFKLCDNEFLLMDFCSPNNKWSYIEEYFANSTHKCNFRREGKERK